MIEAPDACDLCGLSLRGRAVPARIGGLDLSFCCTGCRMVYTTLAEAAGAPDPARFRETDLFRQCQEAGIIPRSEADLESATDPPPDHPLPEPILPPSDDGLRVSLKVGDMWCPACAWVIEAALKKSPGVIQAACHFSTDRLVCDYDPLRTSPDAIRRTVERMGYSAAPPGEDDRRARRRELIRLTVSAVLTMNIMMLSFALYSGFFTELSAESIRNLSWPIFVLATVVLLYGGRPIFHRAAAGLTSGGFTMETLITLGAGSAYGYSVVNLLSGGIHLYFDTAAMLITLVLLGKALEGRARAEISEGLESFFSLRPTKVRIIRPGFPDGRYAAADALQPGDRIAVAPGEVVPADGTIVQGAALVDESSLTGEAAPVRMTAGDRVRAGVVPLDGRLEITAEAVGESSTLGEMIAIMERALAGRSHLEGMADRAMTAFVPAVVALAVGTGGIGRLAGLSLDEAVTRAVTVLVISCPCALGIAVPLTRTAGIWLAGRMGILVRVPDAFERAGEIDTVVFDKTGTLTEGVWRLLDIRTAAGFDADTLLAAAAGLEGSADHPAARAIRTEARKRGIDPAPVTSVSVLDEGISGALRGRPVRIGSADFAGVGAEGFANNPESGLETLASAVYMSVDGSPAGVFRFGDSIRPGAVEALADLRSRGLWTAVISGDSPAAAAYVAEKLGINTVEGGLLPADKADWIGKVIAGGRRVAAVGDGVNDAPALARSSLGMAVHSGTRLGREAADLTLMRPDLGLVAGFFDLSRRINRTVRQNLIFTFCYNVISIPVAMSGFLNPLVAVCAMLMSSLSVIGNTLRLTRRAAGAP